MSLSTPDAEDREMSCSLVNLLAICKGCLRYHIAGKQIDCTLEKMGVHMLLLVNRDGDYIQYVLPLETFERAIHSLTSQGEGTGKRNTYLS